MRETFIKENIALVDKIYPSANLEKHRKMTTSPFVFFRGSAQLYYADIANQTIAFPDAFDEIPLTSIVGDCHCSNFGFLTEEGSHGDTVIFSPNDFDDACVGKAQWDILRFISSLSLAQQHCNGVILGNYCDDDINMSKQVVDDQSVIRAQMAFIDAYTATCERVTNDSKTIYEAMDNRPDAINSKLSKLYDKAVRRSAGGIEFLTKSALAKAIAVSNNALSFKTLPSKFEALSRDDYKLLHTAFSPYMDDTIIDIVRRVRSGTGSVNMERYYFLVGPSVPYSSAHISYCHVVEVKQQRCAAPLYFFPDMNPVNALNAAHLTARSQRRMQRKPDLILDSVSFNDSLFLIRSRHHARVGITPADIVMGKKAIAGGLSYFAQLCGYTLALAHCRGDRRSTRFAQKAYPIIAQHKESLINLAKRHVEQVLYDHSLFTELCKNEVTPFNKCTN